MSSRGESVGPGQAVVGLDRRRERAVRIILLSTSLNLLGTNQSEIERMNILEYEFVLA